MLSEETQWYYGDLCLGNAPWERSMQISASLGRKNLSQMSQNRVSSEEKGELSIDSSLIV